MTEMKNQDLSWQQAVYPVPIVLEGAAVRLVPLDAALHASLLFEASHGSDSDPALWDYLFQGPFTDQRSFTAWVIDCARSKDPLFFAISDKITGRAFGMASYMRITPEHGVIEIGNIWFSKQFQRTRQATEAIYLLARHAFDGLGYRRLEWKCDARNSRSCQAAERFGFTFEGVFRQHMIVKGCNRDTAWYAMLDKGWPAIRAAFEKWLAPQNFNETGQQRQSLAALRSA